MKHPFFSAQYLMRLHARCKRPGRSSAAHAFVTLMEQTRHSMAPATLEQACEWMAAQGPRWNGGREGAIHRRVLRMARPNGQSERTRVIWNGHHEDGCMGAVFELGDLLAAIETGRIPAGFEPGWVEDWPPAARPGHRAHECRVYRFGRSPKPAAPASPTCLGAP